MIIFKTYFKIIKKQSLQLSIYVVVFLSLAILFTYLGNDNSIETFTQSKAKVAFINEDSDTVLTQGLKDYLADHSVFVELDNNTEALQDALFFREVEYIAKIPAGFTNEFMSGKPVAIDKTMISGTVSGIYTDILINKYLNSAALYVKNLKNISQEELVKNLKKDLEVETDVKLLKNSKGKVEKTTSIEFYYNFSPYVLINIIVLGVSSIMMVFNDIKLKRRNLCSPVSNTSYNMQLLLGNVTYSLACWAILIVLSAALYRNDFFRLNSLYFVINTLVLTITILSISFLVGILIKSRNAQTGISNVLSLGMCFLTGVFVPQELLGENVLAIAKILPTYWYIKANKAISNLTVFNWSNLSQIVYYMLIELGFAIAIVSVTLVVSKRNQLKGS